MWDVLLKSDSEHPEGLWPRFLERWRKAGTLSLTFISDKKEHIATAFDAKARAGDAAMIIIDARQRGPKGSQFQCIIFRKTTMQSPQLLAQIEAQVDGIMDKLTADQLFAIIT
jgi:hypothetical protein